MKHPTGYAPPRRLAAPKKQVRLDLRRQASPGSDDELGTRRKSHFWRWAVLVALFHLVAVGLIYWIYEATPTPTPPEPFISLLPPGNIVKGTPGAQEAHKVGPTTAAPSVHHTSPAPKPVPPAPPEPVATPTPVAIQPPTPTPSPIEPKPIVKPEAPPVALDKPVPQPTPPQPPKVKVDLTLADGPATDKPVSKPKPHKKPAPPTPADNANAPDRATASTPESTGLSKEQIAAALGQKVQAAGVTDADKIGASGSDHSKASPFDEFYLSLRDQVMNKWQYPNLAAEPAVIPEVMIHVEKDGRVPPESVTLQRSSGNQAYDDSALAAARSIGYTLQPLPDGCPPDISIFFTLTH